MPALCQLSSPFQFFRSAIWDAWRTKVAGDLVQWVFGVGGFLISGLASPERRGQRAFAWYFVLGGFGMDSLLALSEEKSFPAAFVGVLAVTGICFGSVLISPLFISVRVLNFTCLLSMDRRTWPRCLLWHGWLLALACSGGASPWADSVESIADAWLESSLGSYSDRICREWAVSDRFLADLASSGVSDYPDVWTDE